MGSRQAGAWRPGAGEEDGLDDYSGPFDAAFRLEQLSRAALARLGREYMFYGHIRDRALMPAVAARFGTAGVDRIAIDEWMGASPLYTRRMRRALGIRGDDVPAILKTLQLDVGFPHRYMDVGYEVESEQVGYFWLRHCGALLDVERFGEKAVLSMCHTMEDPTFDATAYAVNPRARVRPVYRPPRRPADRVPHCRWEVRIDPANEPMREPAVTARVRVGRLARFELDAPDVEEGEGRSDYSGAFDAGFALEDLSRRALVTVCKEFLLQHQLLTRASMVALGDAFGPEAARELLATQWRAAAPLATRRLCSALRIGGDDVGELLKLLQVHSMLPQDYLRLGFERLDARRGLFWLEPCAALDDDEPRGLLSLLEGADCTGLDAMVQALDARARCRPSDPAGRGAGRRAWELEIDPDAAPAPESPEAAFVAHSNVTGFVLERGARA